MIDPTFPSFVLTVKSELHDKANFSQLLSFAVTRNRLGDREPLAVDRHEGFLLQMYRSESKLTIMNDNTTDKNL